MKCNINNCGADAHLHCTLVDERHGSNYRQLCDEHANSLLKSLQSAAPSSSGVAAHLRMSLEIVLYDERTSKSWIYLRECKGQRRLVITSGAYEAGVLDMLLRATSVGRPQTHQAFSTTITQLGGTILSATIDNFDEVTGAFFAKLLVSMRDTGREVVVDLRPSDAIALSLVSAAPLMVSGTAAGKTQLPGGG